MRIKILLAAAILFSLCGCSISADTGNVPSVPEVTVNVPSDDSLNGYRLPDSSVAAPSKVTSPTDNNTLSTGSTYYVNKNSKKYHLASCRYAKQIDDDNLIVTDDKDALIAQGYEPCKVCKP